MYQITIFDEINKKTIFEKINSCVRCKKFGVAVFVFDNGDYYCDRCFHYLKGGDFNEKIS